MSAGERWRLFVAVPIGEVLREALSAAVDRWRDRPDLAALRWSEPATWHVTLHFLGATKPDRVPGVVSVLEEVAARHAPMRLATGGLGAFPSAGRARVAWYGVTDIDGRLRAVADDVSRTLSPDDPARFRAHVTLARSRAGDVDLRRWFGAADAPSGQLAVERILLVRSHLGDGPARHEVLESVRMGAAVGV